MLGFLLHSLVTYQIWVRMILRRPLDVANRATQYDLMVKVAGGGLSGQAGAVKHGISQALAKFEPALRGAVKAAGAASLLLWVVIVVFGRWIGFTT